MLSRHFVPWTDIHLTPSQGKDATEEFEPIHPPDTLDKYLHKSKHLGPVDMETVAREEKEEDPEEEERKEREALKPLLSQCYNLFDFEAVARRVMKKTAWGYYSSAADDEIVRRGFVFLSRSHRKKGVTDCCSRRCARTTEPSTASGSDRRSSWTWKKSTSAPPCSEPSAPCPST